MIEKLKEWLTRDKQKKTLKIDDPIMDNILMYDPITGTLFNTSLSRITELMTDIKNLESETVIDDITILFDDRQL